MKHRIDTPEQRRFGIPLRACAVRRRSETSMPPKKAEDASAPEADASDENVLEPRLLEQKAMVERELAASLLATRLARYQKESAALVEERATLMDALETTRAEAGDANAKLSEQLRGVHATVASLRARLAELEGAREADASRREARLASLASESAERRRTMVSDLAARDAIVAQLDAFEDTRATLESELREKEALLKSARAAHETAMRAFETETQLAKQAMKEDLAAKIRETKREMKRVTDSRLAETTKRTIAENERMLGELQFQARESAAMKTSRAAYAADARAADEATALSLRKEKDIAMRNGKLAVELKRLQGRLRAEQAAARVEREMEDAAARAEARRKKRAGGAAKKKKGPFERRDDARALADTLARRTASAAAERDEAETALEALEAATETRGEETVGLAASSREDLVAFLRACARDADELDGTDTSAWQRRRRVIAAALEGLRADAGLGGAQKMLAVMFPQVAQEV